MTKKVEIPMEERTKPYGVILPNETDYKEDPVFEWLPGLKIKMPNGKVTTDFKHILADGQKYIVLEKGQCRSCQKKIKPYKETYFQKHLDYCGPHCFAYGMKNDYCEECAQEKSRIAYIDTGFPTVVKTEAREEFGTGDYLEKQTWSDGMVVEEMTYEEMHRARN